MDAATPGYSHTQKGTICLYLYGLAVVLLIAAWPAQGHETVFLALFVSGITLALITPAFHHLIVEDAGDALAVRFGPLPLPKCRMTIPYDDIVRVEVDQTLRSEGVGIHRSPRGGWVWNIRIGDCVVVHRRNDVLRISVAGSVADCVK